MLCLTYSKSLGGALTGTEDHQLEVHTTIRNSWSSPIIGRIGIVLHLLCTCAAPTLILDESSPSSQQLKVFDCGT